MTAKKATEDVSAALAKTPGSLTRQSRGTPKGGKELTRARRIQALNMRTKGQTWPEIAKALGISETWAQTIVRNLLREAESENIEDLRALENARLDVAQAAIWPQVKKGSLGAVAEFVKISKRRADMNGLDQPQRVVVTGEIRASMETALLELEGVLNAVGIEVPEAEVVDAEIVEDEDGHAA